MKTKQNPSIDELITNLKSILGQNEDHLELISIDQDDEETYPVVIRNDVNIKSIELIDGQIKCHGTNSNGSNFEELTTYLNYDEIAEIYFFIKNEIMC